MMNTMQANGEQPLALYSHNLTHPGVPLMMLISSVALLLSARGVKHELPIDPIFTSDSMVCGTKEVDDRFMSDYLQFNMMVDGLVRQYNVVQVKARSNGSTLMMTISCY